MTGRPGRNWYQVFLLIMCVGAGVLGFLGSGHDGLATFPTWGQYAWYIGLLVGSVTAMVGIAAHNITGLLIERAALLLLTGLCLGYTVTAVIVCIVGTVTSAYGTTLVFLFALLNANRIWQIGHELATERRRAIGLAALTHAQEVAP